MSADHSSDRALLEAAAKAAGLKYTKPHPDYSGLFGLALEDANGRYIADWSPLTDDGDAFRLAVKLQIIVGKYDEYANAGVIGSDVDVVVWGHEEGDPYAATRRAIVQAAASLGRSL